jgi:hypothetical protein
MLESEGWHSWTRKQSTSSPKFPGNTRFRSAQESIRQEEALFSDRKIQNQTLQERLCANRFRFSHVASQIAPIHHIPDELLSKIFLDGALHSTFSDYRNLQKLTLVCSRWWRVARDTPSLWTDITIRWGAGYSNKIRNLDPTLQRLSPWLALSKRAPLHLNLCFPMGSVHAGRMCDALSQRLIKECERWRSICLDGNHTVAPIKRVMKAQNRQLKSLKYVEFAHIDAMEYPIFEGVQARQVARLSFDTTSLNINVLMSILSSIPNLTTLSFRRCYLEKHCNPDFLTPTFQLNELKTIFWDLQYGSSCEDELKDLKALTQILSIAPTLEKLKVFAGDSSVFNPILGGGGSRADWLRSCSISSSVTELNIKVRIEDLDVLQSSLSALTEFVILFPNVQSFIFRLLWSHDADQIMEREALAAFTSAIISAVKCLGTEQLTHVKFARLPLDEEQLHPFQKHFSETEIKLELDTCVTYPLDDKEAVDVSDLLRKDKSNKACDYRDYVSEFDDDSDAPSAEL